MSLRNVLTPASRSIIRSSAPTIQRRAISSTPRRFASASETPNDPAPVAKKSDAPWAIGSILIFGSLFIYLTAPGKKDAHGHDGHAHGKEDHEEEEKPVDEEQEAHFNNPGKVEEAPQDHHPEGNKKLASQSSSLEDGHDKQSKAPKREPSHKADDTTFKKGVAASKDGDHVSNPKAVVAAAHTEKQDKAEQKKADKSAKAAESKKDESEEDESEEKDEGEEEKEE